MSSLLRDITRMDTLINELLMVRALPDDAPLPASSFRIMEQVNREISPNTTTLCLSRDRAAALARRIRKIQIAGGDWRERTDIRNAATAPLWRIPKAERGKCGARTRKGTPCQAPCTLDGLRCRMHGGLSTGPKTEEGRERIRESNRRRAQEKRAAARVI